MKFIELVCCCFAATAMLLFCIFSGVTVVPVGQVGVVTLLGTVQPEPLFPGLALVNPMSSVELFNTQTQVLHFSDDVPTQEGVNVRLKASCLYHLNATAAVDVYERFGDLQALVNVMLVPLFESSMREVTTAHTAAALYTAVARQGMTSALKDLLAREVGKVGLTIESTPINSLEFPALITAAIERKMQLQQEAETMQFVLEKERQEADRRRIEAEGVVKAQQLIANSTTEDMLRWNAIDVTKTLGASCGAKMIFAGEDGLPVMNSKGVVQQA